jgi:hypothetical protein
MRYLAGQVGQRTREDAAALLFSLNSNEFLNSAELSKSHRLLSAARIGSGRGLNAGQRCKPVGFG